MGITTDPNDPGLKKIGPNGMQEAYLVLSPEEIAKGFVRPVRRSYVHVGVRPVHPLRELTKEEHGLYDVYKYIFFEGYPESDSSVTGRFWTKDQLNSGCGATTTMGQALAETYARDPSYYGGTFCATCSKHFTVGADGEFVWSGTNERVGT